MKKFNELNINQDILKAIEEIGHETATLVQEKTIPALKHNDDIIILSQTGSGKTLAFTVPALESVNPDIKKPQVLVICPTRELAMQVSNEFKKLSKYLTGIKTFAVFGGQPISRQIQRLKSKPNIIIGTPGRILDHIKRRTLKLESVNMLVLDEADEMLNMGFKEDIEQINKKLAGKRQGVLASATMSKEIKKLAKEFLNNPIIIDAGNANSPAKSIHQEYITVSQKGKKQLILKMLNELEGKKLIFCNTKRMTTSLYNFLKDNNFEAKEIHGDMRQHERTRAMNAFKKDVANILVATDVAARGIDVSNVNYVINYDYPEMQEYYIHRIGRTGRANNKGTAFTFITNGSQMFGLEMLSKKLEFKIFKSHLSNEIKLTAKKPISRGRFNQRGGKQNNKATYNKKSNNKKSFNSKYKQVRTNNSNLIVDNNDEKALYKKRPDSNFRKKNERAEKMFKQKPKSNRNAFKKQDESNSKKRNKKFLYSKTTSPAEYFGKQTFRKANKPKARVKKRKK